MSEELRSPEEIVELMYSNDPMSRWLGIERVKIGRGTCTLRMKVRDEMLNGFGIAHGGITFSLADSAFAFASNSQGYKAVSIDCNINHLRPVKSGSILTATASEISLSSKVAIYAVDIIDENEIKVAHFKGMVFRKGEKW